MDVNTEASRTHYVYLRNVTGCPPIILVSGDSNHGYGVEVKDGSLYMEVKASSSWDAKCECVVEWDRLQDLKKSEK